MKLIKLIFTLSCLLATIPLLAQEPESKEAYYTLEIAPLSSESSDTSSTSNVAVIIKATDLDKYSSIHVEDSKKTKTLKVSKEDRKSNPNIKTKKDKYHLDMKEWSMDEELEVKATKLDGSVVKLRKHPRGSEFTHTVVTSGPKTRKLKKYDGPEINEEEIKQ